MLVAMTRTMYDGVTATNLPVSAQVVGGYVDGLYKWSASDWARFPNALKVRIAVFRSTDDGHVLDVEPGNATPAESVDWVLMRRAAGVDPTVYMNSSTWAEVRAAFNARRVAEPHYWVAAYDGVANIPAGAIGKQYYNNNALGYDLSVVADYWPGVDPAPSAPVPVTPEDDLLITFAISKGPNGENPGIWGLSGNLYFHIPTLADQAALVRAGVKQVTVDYALHQSILASLQTTPTAPALPAAGANTSADIGAATSTDAAAG